MRLPLVLALLPLLLTAAPATAKDFAALHGEADPVSSLGSFLEDYVGECKDPFEKAACQRNAAQQRKGLAGKLFYVRLQDRHSRLFQIGRELDDGRLQLVVTPFFDANGYGLSSGKPTAVDGAGNPRMRLLPFTTKLPAGMTRRDVELAMRTGNLRVELIFVPKSAWRLKRRGDEDAQGVAATFKALKLTSARTGQTVAEVIF